MRIVSLLLIGLLVYWPNSANAWFFYFYGPGAEGGRVGEALPDMRDDYCVSSTASVGDVLKGPNGTTATIKSLSGISSRCANPALPVLAVFEFNRAFASKAGIDVPEGFIQKPLTDKQKLNGSLLKAEKAEEKAGFLVLLKKREAYGELASAGDIFVKALVKTLDEPQVLHEEKLIVNGLQALRYEVVGKAKATPFTAVTHVMTLLYASEELVVINAWSPTIYFDKNREVLRQLSDRISGLYPPAPGSLVMPLSSTADDDSHPDNPQALPHRPGASETQSPTEGLNDPHEGKETKP